MSLFIHDELIGHVPNPGFRGSGFGNSFHTIDANGLRHTGEDLGSSEQGPILTLGDSYTYGDEVVDEDAWPAQLQELTNRRVLNGGVTGYGIDQMVLRAEQLVPVHKPAVVVLSFIADDVSRTEMRRKWWRDKPWFALEDDKLVLKGVPVPNRQPVPLHLRHRIEEVVVRQHWYIQTVLGYHRRAHPVGYGLVLAPRLIERLARFCANHEARLIVMAQYDNGIWLSQRHLRFARRVTATVLEAARIRGAAVLDTYQRLAIEPNPRSFYAVGHMNGRGNRAIASLLAATMPALLGGENDRATIAI